MYIFMQTNLTAEAVFLESSEFFINDYIEIYRLVRTLKVSKVSWACFHANDQPKLFRSVQMKAEMAIACMIVSCLFNVVSCVTWSHVSAHRWSDNLVPVALGASFLKEYCIFAPAASLRLQTKDSGVTDLRLTASILNNPRLPRGPSEQLRKKMEGNQAFLHNQRFFAHVFHYCHNNSTKYWCMCWSPTLFFEHKKPYQYTRIFKTSLRIRVLNSVLCSWITWGIFVIAPGVN